MYSRETNKRLLIIFLFCAAVIVAVTWTLSEKFIGDSTVAFFVNLGVALVIAVLFERYLEYKLNASTDALIEKLRKVAKGDLTQRFKEDPDSVLPYGLAYEMGHLMTFYRENIGNLWKVSAQLSRQLTQLLSTAQELFGEFRAEVDYLSTQGENLEKVRTEMQDIAKRVSGLRVNASNDSAFMAQMDEVTERALKEIKAHREVVGRISEDIRGIDTLAGNMKSVMSDFLDMCGQVSEIGKSVSDLSTETGLVKLNAAIDSVQSQGGKEANYKALVGEIQVLLEKINNIKQTSANVAGLTENRIQDMGRRLKSGNEKLKEGLADADQTRTLFERMGEDYMAVAASFDSIFENVNRLNALMTDVDGKTVNFAGSIKLAAEGFDKLKADTQITLLKFGQLSEKMDGVRESLKKLEEFKNLFQIA